MSPIDQEGKSIEFNFNHSSALRSELIPSALAMPMYVWSSASNYMSSNTGMTRNELTSETSGLSVASLCRLKIWTALNADNGTSNEHSSWCLK